MSLNYSTVRNYSKKLKRSWPALKALVFFPGILFFFFISSCSNDNRPDVSGIRVDVKIDRFEEGFFSIDTNQVIQGMEKLFAAYPQFTGFFTRQLLGLNQVSGDTSQMVLKQILAGYRPVYDSLREKYPNLNWLKKELDEAFRHVKYYYPAYKVPHIMTFIGTFDAPGIVYTPHYLAIGLQQYAGKNFSAYRDPQVQQVFPDYISRRFDKEYMTANMMKAVVDDIYPDTTDNAKLIELMIEKGKQWWLLDKFLPEAPDSVKTGYTRQQLEWCNKNEGNIWGSVLQNTPDIYTLDQERLQNYIGESPRTMDMPEESPGNIGQWIGWQIVKKFEEKNESMTVQQILATPAVKIFQEARYKPK